MITKRDEELIQSFWAELQSRTVSMDIPCHYTGNKEIGDENAIWLVVYTFQVFMIRYELFINIHVEDEQERYGWQELGLI
jgi:hypothetical protein